MDDIHFTVIDLVGHWGTAGAEHTTVEIAVVHAQHHATDILIILLTLPSAGIGPLLHKRLQNIV